MEKYYYKQQGWKCLEKCHIHESAYIGSGNCMDCIYYKGGSRTDRYVICKHLQPKRKTNWKKILLRIAAVLLWIFIILGLNILSIKEHFLQIVLSGAMVGLIAYWGANYLWNLSNKK